MKRKWLLLLVWFVVLLVYNVGSRWTQNTDKNMLFVLLQAVGYMTTPIQLFLSALVIFVIFTAKRKPMADR